ncbi:MAG: restriction endonuclease [Verrucomicrobiota bacterium]
MSNAKPKAQKRSENKKGLEKVEFYLGKFDEVLCSYLKTQPEWRSQVLIWLFDYGLRCLKAHLEPANNKTITWHSPFLSLEYPVDCTCSDGGPRNPVQIALHSGMLTTENTRTKKIAEQTLSRLLVKHLTVSAMQEFTNHVYFHKSGESYFRVIPENVVAHLNTIRSKQVRDRLVESLYDPFSMGAAQVDIDDKRLKDEKPIPRKLAKQLKNLHERIHLPAIWWNVQKDSHQMRLSLIFQIHPLVFDLRTKQAHFPLTVGLFLHPPEQSDAGRALIEMGQPWMDPGSWSKRDRAALWKKLFSDLAQWSKQLCPPPPKKLAEAIVTVTARIKMAVDQHRPASTADLFEKMVKAMKKSGEIIHLESSIDSATVPQREQLIEGIAKIQKAKRPAEKGIALETLVETLLKTIPGLTVSSRVLTDTEEIDLFVLNNVENGWLSRQHPVILVECKNWSSVCGKNEFVTFKEKMLNRKGQCSLGVLISWNGFADTVTKEMLRGSRERHVILLMDGNSLRKSAERGSFLPELEVAWKEAILH